MCYNTDRKKEITRKEIKIMKLTIYHIVNKETRKSIYGNCRRREVEQYLATLENAEQFEIVAHYNTCV